MFGATFAGSVLLHYLLNYGENEVLKAWSTKNTALKEFEFILSKLEEAIITKDTVNNSISYANKKGRRILSQLAPYKDEAQTIGSKLFKQYNYKNVSSKSISSSDENE